MFWEFSNDPPCFGYNYMESSFSIFFYFQRPIWSQMGMGFFIEVIFHEKEHSGVLESHDGVPASKRTWVVRPPPLTAPHHLFPSSSDRIRPSKYLPDGIGLKAPI
jgi:hypothetical protein